MGDSLPALARVHGRKFRHGSAPRSAPSSPLPPSRRGSLVSPSVLVGGAPYLSVWSATIQTDGETTQTPPTGAQCASAHNNNIPSIFSYHIISYLIISYRPIRIRSHTTAYDRIRPHRLSAGQKRQFPPPRSAVCTHRSAPRLKKIGVGNLFF